MPARDQISLGIIAGGQGSRLGFAEKSTLQFRGHSLLASTLAAAGTGFADVLLSYNGSDIRNERPGMRWVRDRRAPSAGPLAGIESLLCAASTPWLLTLPVDLRDQQSLAINALCNATEAPAMIVDGDGLQPLVSLWRVQDARPVVTAALDHGQAAVHALMQPLRMVKLDISPHRLGNLNTPADFD